MRADPQVSRLKHEAEVARLREREDLLQLHGCWLYRSVFPHIDLIFLPRHPARITLPVPKAGALLMLPGGRQQFELQIASFPSFSARPFGIRLALDDYDLIPPSLTFCDPRTWEPLSADACPVGFNMDNPRTPMQVVQAAHPAYGRPFLCMPGTREYHEHPQHTGDSWLLYRGDLDVFALIATVARTCIDSATPVLGIHPVQLGPVRLESQWRPQSPHG